jgi:ribosome biogenesis GTPase / thiamine phosphate phosphatase
MTAPALPGTPPDPAVLPPGTTLARVVRVDRGAVELATPTGLRRVSAALAPVVGDWLAVDDGGEPVVVLPRRSLLVRAAAQGTSTVQPLAAGVDVVLVCVAVSPRVQVRRVERLLALVWDSGATPVVVVTKADLTADVGEVRARLRPHAPGVDVVAVSAEAGDVGALDPWLRAGTTLALLGTSGAGKSTLLNALAGQDLAATGAVRATDGKGRHVTTARELFVLPGGAVVIDTPGLRGVGLHDSPQGVALAFADVEDLGSACRFADCAHDGEPGCAVAASVEAGDLAQVRVDSWRRLKREADWHARRSDARLRAEEKARWKALHRAQRARPARPGT